MWTNPFLGYWLITAGTPVTTALEWTGHLSRYGLPCVLPAPASSAHSRDVVASSPPEFLLHGVPVREDALRTMTWLQRLGRLHA